MPDSKSKRFSSSYNVRSNSSSHGLGDLDEFMANESAFSTSTTTSASFAGGNLSATTPTNILQRQIISMEDDEFADDQDSISGKYQIKQYLIKRKNLKTKNNK